MIFRSTVFARASPRAVIREKRRACPQDGGAGSGRGLFCRAPGDVMDFDADDFATFIEV